MTDQELQAVRERCAAAAPGPWHAESGEADPDAAHPPAAYTILTGPGGTPLATVWEQASGDFIAHAREDVPALLAEVERLRAELKGGGGGPAVTDAELDAIRARAERASPLWPDYSRASAADVPALLAEVERLRRLLDGLAARAAAQAELLARRAEGPTTPPA